MACSVAAEESPIQMSNKPGSSAQAWVAVGAIIAAPAVVCVAAMRARRPEFSLQGCYQGYQICFYRSLDPRVFNQVKRGLTRALEAHDNW